ncbi:response regulator [Streptomyces sp. 1222.5]|uniref:response regulator n=1 Tax=Streptomyces sp. 1222.5 TaxID=1881026 RepID=UPI003EBE50CA
MILIVDDMEENLIALEAVLGTLGQVVRARSGEAALKAMLRQEFAVVLLDVYMPDMDGFETAANIKHLDQTKDVPIILLTGADADHDFAYRGYSVGAADFLTKPVEPWLLRTKVGVFLDLHRKNRQLAAQAEQLRRLLVGKNHGPQTDEVPPVESLASTSAIAAGQGAASHGTANGKRPVAEFLLDRLSNIEVLLRVSDGTEASELAGRISEVQRLVETLYDQNAAESTA